MQSSMRPAGGDGPGAGFQLIAAVAVALLILLTQTIFIVPAGTVAVAVEDPEILTISEQVEQHRYARH